MDERTLEYIAELSRLALPLIQSAGLKNVFREDVVQPSYDRERLMANAKKKLDGAYQVPRTVE